MTTILDLHRRDTICAAATPALPSALAMIRVSGPDALNIQKQIFSPKKGRQEFFVATLGDVGNIDEGVCVSYPEGKSFTGEPSFELSLHGSPIIVKEVLEFLQRVGCRAANPGEFSLRAVLSGKIDLCAAEAVCDLISARSTEAAQVALRNVKGGLGKHLEPVRDAIINTLCEVEARLDFPDEDLGEKKRDQLLEELSTGLTILKKLLDGAELGRKLTQGARLVILGLPNAGKSTLLNTLVGEDRALVHHLPGTTRDVVEVTWIVHGIPVSLIDVAGIRDTHNIDPVEALGIEKALREVERADGVLWLVDGTRPEDENILIRSLIESLSAPVLKVYTKIDLMQNPPAPVNDVWISAKTGEGIENFYRHVRHLLVNDVSAQHDALLTRVRQKEEVQTAFTALCAAKEILSRQEADEIVASELRASGAALDRLLGKALNEDVLDLIFSRFCIGK